MTHLTAKTGYVFCSKDKSKVYTNSIYISDIDSANNYIQITTDEANTIANSPAVYRDFKIYYDKDGHLMITYFDSED